VSFAAACLVPEAADLPWKREAAGVILHMKEGGRPVVRGGEDPD
jgi:hypothetical protein